MAPVVVGDVLGGRLDFSFSAFSESLTARV